MLELREAQLLALVRDRLDDDEGRAFVASVTEWARDAYWEMFLGRSPAQVTAKIRAIVERAMDHGLLRLDHVRAFVQLELAHGPEFDRRTPYVARTFADPRLPPGAKLALVRQRLEPR